MPGVTSVDEEEVGIKFFTVFYWQARKWLQDSAAVN